GRIELGSHRRGLFVVELAIAQADTAVVARVVANEERAVALGLEQAEIAGGDRRSAGIVIAAVERKDAVLRFWKVAESVGTMFVVTGSIVETDEEGENLRVAVGNVGAAVYDRGVCPRCPLPLFAAPGAIAPPVLDLRAAV